MQVLLLIFVMAHYIFRIVRNPFASYKWTPAMCCMIAYLAFSICVAYALPASGAVGGSYFDGYSSDFVCGLKHRLAVSFHDGAIKVNNGLGLQTAH